MNRFILAVAFLIVSYTAASASSCSQLYPNNFQYTGNTTELCNSFYVVQFDEKNNIPLFSAELLKPNQPSVTRSNDFHPDVRLNKEVRAENSDYDATGYDKGHMTPAEDASTAQEMHDTFLLSNMTPQSPILNRQPWRMLEEAVHKQVNASSHPIHIVTGAIYSKGEFHAIGFHHIQIPVAYYKIIYLDSGIETYYAVNSNSAVVQKVTVADLQQYVPFVIK